MQLLPLTKWFQDFYLVGDAKTGIPSPSLKRKLGVNYRTVWLVHNKIMQAMSEREKSYVLRGKVQLDDAYLGGELNGGKAGRGSGNKVPIVAAGIGDLAGGEQLVDAAKGPIELQQGWVYPAADVANSSGAWSTTPLPFTAQVGWSLMPGAEYFVFAYSQHRFSNRQAVPLLIARDQVSGH